MPRVGTQHQIHRRAEGDREHGEPLEKTQRAGKLAIGELVNIGAQQNPEQGHDAGEIENAGDLGRKRRSRHSRIPKFCEKSTSPLKMTSPSTSAASTATHPHWALRHHKKNELTASSPNVRVIMAVSPP
jgi:hypothetical protein